MLNELIHLLEAAGWPAPSGFQNAVFARWGLPSWGTVYNRFIEAKMLDGRLLLIKHVIGGISSASFDSADSLFRFLLPYTEMVNA